MATAPTPVIVSSHTDDERMVPREHRRALWAVALMVTLAVVVQVSLVPYVRVADGLPDVLAAAVVCVALFRGSLVGAVAGFGGGLLVELTAPVGTLGVLALLYLLAGWLCGRWCERPESYAVLPTIVLAMGAAGFIQVAQAGVHALLGHDLATGELTARLIVPTLALTALVTPPVLLLARRLLGDPRLYEPAVRV